MELSPVRPSSSRSKSRSCPRTGLQQYSTALAICLLLTTGPAAAGLHDDGTRYEIPNRFVKFDGIDLGVGAMFHSRGGLLATMRMAKASCTVGRFSIGAAIVDGYGAFFPEERGAAMMLPVHIGFVLWANPKKTWFFCGAVPDAYVEASYSLLDDGWTYRPSARVALCCDLDRYGLGAGLEFGWVSLPIVDFNCTRRANAVYFSVRAQALIFRIGF